ncbi:MAG: dehydrogenase, partial [Gloeobacteraceae cyanobacterium ES-bin-316]|nr:dehydrogenase [Ferruginibacter sp.]
MIYHCKAPLRIGLAGGGTDVSPYCDTYGGAVLNATISLYAHASIATTNDNLIFLHSKDRNEEEIFPTGSYLPINGCLDLHKAVYNRLQKDYPQPLTGFRLTTHTDAPTGSGLGTSSTLVVAIIGAFLEMYKLQMSKDAIARYAFEIERNDLGFSGGRQDQYAAAFGGINFIEFFKNGETGITPLNVSEAYKHTLERQLVLYFTDTSRNSAAIIDEQVKNVREKNENSIQAMHHLKEQAYLMKDIISNRHPDELGPVLHVGFSHKKNMAANISNLTIETLYAAAVNAGATGGKISGAGGGGFMVFYCP